MLYVDGRGNLLTESVREPHYVVDIVVSHFYICPIDIHTYVQRSMSLNMILEQGILSKPV